MSNTRDMTSPSLRHAILIAASTAAYSGVTHADPVRFDNDGSFTWETLERGQGTDNSILDITRPANDQPGYGSGPNGLDNGTQVAIFGRHYDYYGGAWDSKGWLFLRGDLSAGVYTAYKYADPYLKGDMVFNFTQGREIGFNDEPWLNLHTDALFHTAYCDAGCHYLTWFPRRQPGYVGLKLSIDGETHFGWIGVVRGGRDGIELDAFAWGYETTPDTAIAAGAVPVPGTLAALAFGAGALGRRSRARA